MENHNPADHGGGPRAGVVCLRKVECHHNFHFFGKMVNRVQEEQFRHIHEETRTRGAEHADRIAAIRFLEKILLQILIGAIGITGIPAITNLETVVCIYTMLMVIGRLLILKMGRQDADPGFRLMSARIAVVLGCVRCCLLMYIPLRVMPWPIFVLRILELMNP